jgi:hypothetical protein
LKFDELFVVLVQGGGGGVVHVIDVGLNVKISSLTTVPKLLRSCTSLTRSNVMLEPTKGGENDPVMVSVSVLALGVKLKVPLVGALPPLGKSV